jgi:hypothetical protein
VARGRLPKAYAAQLKGCLQCLRAIPWPRNDSTTNGWAYPAQYAKRQFCSRRCHHDFMRGRKHGPAPAVTTIGTRGHVDALERCLPRREEITSCTKCRRTALIELSVGRQCYTCGNLMFCVDGDWSAEAARPQFSYE